MSFSDDIIAFSKKNLVSRGNNIEVKTYDWYVTDSCLILGIT